MPENSIDAVVTDPPYGFSFMGKKWDYGLPSVDIWKECLRVLKPGGHMLAFGGPRTYHRLACGIEDAGFEIRDQIQWLQGQGFPKNLNIQKAAIKAGLACGCTENSQHDLRPLPDKDIPTAIDAEDESKKILQHILSEQGISEFRSERSSTLCGPEPMLARGELYRAEERLQNDSDAGSPQSEKERLCSGAHSGSRTNVGQTTETERRSASSQSRQSRQSTGESKSLQESQGTLDGSPFRRCTKCQKPILPQGLGSSLKPANEPICLARKPLSEDTVAKNVLRWSTGALNIDACRVKLQRCAANVGRWPSNLILSHSEHCEDDQCDMFECPIALLDEQSGTLKNGGQNYKNKEIGGTHGWSTGKDSNFAGDFGGASRFFFQARHASATRFRYVAKVSSKERNQGCEGLPKKKNDWQRESSGLSKSIKGRLGEPDNSGQPKSNHHPTVKPIKLMTYLCRLVTPPGGTILDPFMGSGSTGMSALKEGFKFIGIEREKEYFDIAEKRVGSV